MRVRTSNAAALATIAAVARAQSAYGSIGQSVQPGRVITRAERQQRRVDRADSAVSTLDGLAEEKPDIEFEHNWAGFKAKISQDIELIHFLEQLGPNIEQDFASSGGPSSVQDPRRTREPFRLHSVIVLIIFFLLAFGALYTLIDYLLFSCRASACSISTVYFPVPYTVTSAIPLASAEAAGGNTAPTTTYTSTVTQVQTLTSYLSLQPEAAPPTSLTYSSGPSYVYTVNSAGVTEWVNGVSPSSGASTATITTTVVLKPVPQSDAATSVQSTRTEMETVTPPAYTSTIYSYGGPDLTSTSTSTHYVTMTLSEVSPSARITTKRTSFPGISSTGWNASSSTDSALDANAAQTQSPVSTTITEISYFGTGDKTTSTTTEFITTTVAEEYTTTVSQVIQSPVGTGYVTTITGLPVTITAGAGTPLFSTKVTIPGPNSSSTPSSESIANPGMGTSNSTASAMPSTYVPSFPMSSGALSSSRGSRAPAASQISRNTTRASAEGQSSRVSKSETSISASVSKSITSTGSAAGSPGSQSPSLSSQAISSVETHSLSSQYQITSTLSSFKPNLSPKVTANNTSSEVPNVSPPSRSSGVSAGPLTAGSLSNLPSNSLSGESATMSSPLTNSTTSSAFYGYPNPGLSSTSSPTSLSIANSFTSVSSMPSTLITSTRSASSQVISSPVPASSTPLLSRTSGVSVSSSSSNSTARATSNSTPTQITGTISSGVHHTSLASNASATSPSATNPFPPSSATATPTGGCGERGNFMVDFDDLPRFLPTNPNGTDITQAAPIFNPYHHLTFSDGYVYAPEPREPYQPVSQPHLAVFLANATGKTASPFDSLVKPGEIGDGPRDPMSAFWFDANSAFLGCDNPGPDPCTLVLSAYTWSQATNKEVLTHSDNVTIPACKTLTSLNCPLQKVEFPTSFRGLTGLQVQAYTGSDQRMFFMDDLAMRWSNNSCAAGLLRQSSR